MPEKSYSSGRMAEVNPFIRKTLLTWIGRSMASPDRRAKTETGRFFRLKLASQRRIVLQAEDGELEMPDYVLDFTGTGAGTLSDY